MPRRGRVEPPPLAVQEAARRRETRVLAEIKRLGHTPCYRAPTPILRELDEVAKAKIEHGQPVLGLALHTTCRSNCHEPCFERNKVLRARHFTGPDCPLYHDFHELRLEYDEGAVVAKCGDFEIGRARPEVAAVLDKQIRNFAYDVIDSRTAEAIEHLDDPEADWSAFTDVSEKALRDDGEHLKVRMGKALAWLWQRPLPTGEVNGRGRRVRPDLSFHFGVTRYKHVYLGTIEDGRWNAARVMLHRKGGEHTRVNLPGGKSYVVSDVLVPGLEKTPMREAAVAVADTIISLPYDPPPKGPDGKRPKYFFASSSPAWKTPPRRARWRLIVLTLAGVTFEEVEAKLSEGEDTHDIRYVLKAGNPETGDPHVLEYALISFPVGMSLEDSDEYLRGLRFGDPLGGFIDEADEDEAAAG
jgi:hypothetical protein